MGMYCGIMLTPTKPGIVPDTKNVIELLNWLIRPGDLLPPSVTAPIEVEVRDDEGVEFDEEEFTAIDGKLETFLNDNRKWSIFLSLPFRGIVENYLPEDSLSYVLRLPTEQEAGEFTDLSTIRISKVNVKSFAWGDDDTGWPDRDFSIILCSDLKMRDEGGLEDNYPEVAWAKLVATKKIEQIQNILGFTLEPWPYIC